MEESQDGYTSDAVLIVGDTMEYVTGIPATPHRVIHEDGSRQSISFHTYSRPDAKLFKHGSTTKNESIYVRELYDKKRTKNITIKGIFKKLEKTKDITGALKKFLVL